MKQVLITKAGAPEVLQTVEVAEGVAETIELIGIDTDDDSLKFIITSLPLHGTLRDELNGQVGFTPRELFGRGVIYTSGTPGDLSADSFTFVANDGREESAQVTVNIEFVSASRMSEI